MSSTGNDPKTIQLKVPQDNKEECLKIANSLGFKFPIPGLAIFIKSRYEPRKDKKEPGVTQVET
jgi:hypothetical protein